MCCDYIGKPLQFHQPEFAVTEIDFLKSKYGNFKIQIIQQIKNPGALIQQQI
jgi:hypothetical protein